MPRVLPVAEDETGRMTIYVPKSVLGNFRAAVSMKHGSVYGRINDEVSEALKLWTRILNGEVKAPK